MSDEQIIDNIQDQLLADEEERCFREYEAYQYQDEMMCDIEHLRYCLEESRQVEDHLRDQLDLLEARLGDYELNSHCN